MILDINHLRTTDINMVVLGNYSDIIQSILDFDFVAGKPEPSVKAIIATGRKFQRFFWGPGETIIPVYPDLDEAPQTLRRTANVFVTYSSGRRTLPTVEQAVEKLPKLELGSLFAENVPEQHALDIYRLTQKKHIHTLGPASIGLLIPGQLKLGAIGGTTAQQLVEAHLFEPGNVAAFSASGGMTNEIINLLTKNNKRLSFSLAFGGDRFPNFPPAAALLAAEADPDTEYIVYFGELGGYDEYDLVELLNTNQITKPLIAYIAGSIAEMFTTPPQFGHAKAMAKHDEETAFAKRQALKAAGAHVADSFTQFIKLIKQVIPDTTTPKNELIDDRYAQLAHRRRALFTSTISGEQDGNVKILGQDITQMLTKNSFAKIVASMWLGKPIKSTELEAFVDLILRLTVDHSPQVSGGVNTMIAARAGKDLVSSLAAGLLTIGPRFGGAINQAANNWLLAVKNNQSPHDFVESYAKQKQYIMGIGHRKYRVDNPDPRVKLILKHAKQLKQTPFLDFARAVETITTGKKANLILNVDGAIAAVMLDLLQQKEKYSYQQLTDIIDIEFFNAIFVLSRSVGLIAHYLDQRRLDEGLFRLPTEDLTLIT